MTATLGVKGLKKHQEAKIKLLHTTHKSCKRQCDGWKYHRSDSS